uniref:Uncharacterized protein n=1 Tax=Compsopogon caeruleus TaxID=31354 RepID=A0A7S1XDD7_9RHOD|mmetsp:Transcript_15091/g.30659  ORF Transcript_15091/g.30659 Transcript_15091/m.30659 type:complete len:172 (+) Transcript_15091:81-596(+)
MVIFEIVLVGGAVVGGLAYRKKRKQRKGRKKLFEDEEDQAREFDDGLSDVDGERVEGVQSTVRSDWERERDAKDRARQDEKGGSDVIHSAKESSSYTWRDFSGKMNDERERTGLQEDAIDNLIDLSENRKESSTSRTYGRTSPPVYVSQHDLMTSSLTYGTKQDPEISLLD